MLINPQTTVKSLKNSFTKIKTEFKNKITLITIGCVRCCKSIWLLKQENVNLPRGCLSLFCSNARKHSTKWAETGCSGGRKFFRCNPTNPLHGDVFQWQPVFVCSHEEGWSFGGQVMSAKIQLTLLSVSVNGVSCQACKTRTNRIVGLLATNLIWFKWKKNNHSINQFGSGKFKSHSDHQAILKVCYDLVRL